MEVQPLLCVTVRITVAVYAPINHLSFLRKLVDIHAVDSKEAKLSSTGCGLLVKNLSPFKSPLSQNQLLQKSNHHLRSDRNDNCRTSSSSHLMSVSQPIHPAYSFFDDEIKLCDPILQHTSTAARRSKR